MSVKSLPPDIRAKRCLPSVAHQIETSNLNATLISKCSLESDSVKRQQVAAFRAKHVNRFRLPFSNGNNLLKS